MRRSISTSFCQHRLTVCAAAAEHSFDVRRSVRWVGRRCSAFIVSRCVAVVAVACRLRFRFFDRPYAITHKGLDQRRIKSENSAIRPLADRLREARIGFAQTPEGRARTSKQCLDLFHRQETPHRCREFVRHHTRADVAALRVRCATGAAGFHFGCEASHASACLELISVRRPTRIASISPRRRAA